MRKIKLLFVVVGLEIGGIEVFLSRFLPRLNREKYEITVCAMKKWGVIGDILVKEGIKVVALNGKNKFSFGILLKLFRLIHREKFEIIQSQLYLANIAAGIVLTFAKWTTPGRVTPFFILNHRELGLWQKWYHDLLMRIMSYRADMTLCCSQAVRKVVIKKYGLKENKCVVVYNGVFLREGCLETEGIQTAQDRAAHVINGINSPFIVGSIGRLIDNVKGYSCLIEAINCLKCIFGDDSMLIIVGDGPDRRMLEDQVKILKLEEQVKFIGGKHSISEYLKKTDIFVLASVSEGFPNVLLEAMAVSKPVVATRIGGIPEVVVEGETGLLVPPRDPKALAEAIYYMKTHPMEAQEMGRKGRKRVEEFFSIDKTVAEYERFYDEIIQRRFNEPKSFVFE
ncbi:MAG: glycosyltransferase [Nitrospiria bacterium]